MLSLIVEPKENRYLNSGIEREALWGEISIFGNKTLILHGEWDVLELIIWFLERENVLKLEQFPLKEIQGECIAEKYENARDELVDIDEELQSDYFDDILSEYWGNHYFVLRGSVFNSFYIGINNGSGEVSYFDKEAHAYKSFSFDMTFFLKELRKISQEFILKWHSTYYTAEGYTRIVKIEKQFGIKLNKN